MLLTGPNGAIPKAKKQLFESLMNFMPKPIFPLAISPILVQVDPVIDLTRGAYVPADLRIADSRRCNRVYRVCSSTVVSVQCWNGISQGTAFQREWHCHGTESETLV